jgi:SAM-dependent methyltransferase
MRRTLESDRYTARKIDYGERADFYDIEYSTTEDRQFLESLVTADVGSILEVPCGAGRNLNWLAATGREVVLADLELSMVDRVEAKVRSLKAKERVCPVVADMRNLNLDRVFDLILVPSEGFQMLAEHREALRALESLRNHLAPSGLLMTDLSTFAKDDCASQNGQPARRPVLEWSRRLPSGETLVRYRLRCRQGDRITTEYFYEVYRRRKLRDSFRSEVNLGKYDLRSFSDLVDRSGLEMRQVFGDYSRKPYVSGDHRIVALLGRGL